jgi:DNA invertase Pin-like site-specific DNA recombinase
VSIDELDLTLIFVKEGSVLNKDSRSHEKFIHGIKVLMAKNYIDNLSEETRKGMQEKAEEGEFPAYAPLGYLHDKTNKTMGYCQFLWTGILSRIPRCLERDDQLSPHLLS